MNDLLIENDASETPKRLKELKGFSTIAQLKEGQAFGELALIQ